MCKIIQPNKPLDLDDLIAKLLVSENSYVETFKPDKFHKAINHLPQFFLARKVYAAINGRRNPTAATIFVVLLSHLLWHILFVMALSYIFYGPNSYEFRPKAQLSALLIMLKVAFNRANNKETSEEKRLELLKKIKKSGKHVLAEIEKNNLQDTPKYSDIYIALKKFKFIAHPSIDLIKESPDNNWSCYQRLMNMTPSTLSLFSDACADNSQKTQLPKI